MASEIILLPDSNNLLLIWQAVTVRPEKSLPDYKPPVEGGGLTAPRRAESLAKVVFVVDADNKAQARRVRTGIASDTDLEILEGIQEGDRVVEGPYRTLSKEIKSGDMVREPQQAGPGGSKS